MTFHLFTLIETARTHTVINVLFPLNRINIICVCVFLLLNNIARRVENKNKDTL